MISTLFNPPLSVIVVMSISTFCFESLIKQKIIFGPCYFILVLVIYLFFVLVLDKIKNFVLDPYQIFLGRLIQNK